jgi:hypothetical protein
MVSVSNLIGQSKLSLNIALFLLGNAGESKRNYILSQVGVIRGYLTAARSASEDQLKQIDGCCSRAWMAMPGRAVAWHRSEMMP